MYILRFDFEVPSWEVYQCYIDGGGNHSEGLLASFKNSNDGRNQALAFINYLNGGEGKLFPATRLREI